MDMTRVRQDMIEGAIGLMEAAPTLDIGGQTAGGILVSSAAPVTVTSFGDKMRIFERKTVIVDTDEELSITAGANIYLHHGILHSGTIKYRSQRGDRWDIECWGIDGLGHKKYRVIITLATGAAIASMHAVGEPLGGAIWTASLGGGSQSGVEFFCTEMELADWQSALQGGSSYFAPSQGAPVAARTIRLVNPGNSALNVMTADLIGGIGLGGTDGSVFVNGSTVYAYVVSDGRPVGTEATGLILSGHTTTIQGGLSAIYPYGKLAGSFLYDDAFGLLRLRVTSKSLGVTSIMGGDDPIIAAGSTGGLWVGLPISATVIPNLWPNAAGNFGYEIKGSGVGIIELSSDPNKDPRPNFSETRTNGVMYRMNQAITSHSGSIRYRSTDPGFQLSVVWAQTEGR